MREDADNGEPIKYGSTPISTSLVIALGASLQCRVENTKCPVMAAWKCDFGGLVVADFADQDHVRVLAQDRSQVSRESQTGLHVDCGLADAFEFILDWVLAGHDVAPTDLIALNAR